jgi:hypothetical protein
MQQNVHPKTQLSAIKVILLGKISRIAIRRSQNAICWINATMTLFSLKALYLIEATRMIESPRKEARNSKMSHPAQTNRSTSLPMIPFKVRFIPFVDMNMIDEGQFDDLQ